MRVALLLIAAASVLAPLRAGASSEDLCKVGRGGALRFRVIRVPLAQTHLSNGLAGWKAFIISGLARARSGARTHAASTYDLQESLCA